MTKLYLAGSSADADRCARWHAKLVAQGIAVTSTWLSVIATVGSANPRDASRDDRERWSTADLAELHAADVVWFLVPPIDKPTRGAWLELGVAVSANKRVVCSGDTRQSIFCALGEEFATDEDAFLAVTQ